MRETVNKKISWFTNWKPHTLEEPYWANDSQVRCSMLCRLVDGPYQ